MALTPDPAFGTALAGPGRRDLFVGNWLAIFSMVIWAAGFPAAELLLDTWHPLTLTLARLAMSMAFLIPLWWMIEGPNAVLRANWGRGLWIGGLGFGLGMYLFLVAQWLTDPVTVALIASAAPITAAILEFTNRTRRPTWAFAIGLFASVLGGIIATTGMAMGDLGLGAGLAVLSAFLFSWASLAAVRDFPDLTTLGRTTITFAGGLVTVAILFLLSNLAGFAVMPRAAVDAQQIGLLAIYAIAGMALSQLLFIASVGRIGIALASLHINVAPFYVMMILLILGEAWSLPKAIGAAVVGLGVIIAQRR